MRTRASTRARAKSFFRLYISQTDRSIFYSKSPYTKSSRTKFVRELSLIYRADTGTRTPDPFITNEMLYQLSHVGGFINRVQR